MSIVDKVTVPPLFAIIFYVLCFGKSLSTIDNDFFLFAAGYVGVFYFVYGCSVLRFDFVLIFRLHLQN